MKAESADFLRTFPHWRRRATFGTMSPDAALEMQIERYRQMSPGERIELALRLHEFASEVARSGIRAQHPDAGPEQVEALLRERRRLAYVL